MSKECENKNPLKRDGTSQQQRLIKALLPSYVSVDERSMEDLREFAWRYAELINFYNSSNTIDGTWESFFKDQVIDEQNELTKPHYALFIAFLDLFRFAQDDMNTITQRHLDFYYRDVLRLEEKAAVPDQVFVIFKLAQQVLSGVLPAETGLAAGKDATGVDRVYKTNREVALNVAQVSELKALYYNYNNGHDGRLYASPIANSANGQGEEIETEEPKWRTFGNIADPSAPYIFADRPQANIGFAFASPVLRLAEGTRTVTITLKVASTAGITNAVLTNAFRVYFSGAEKWISPETNSSDGVYVASSTTIVIKRTLSEGQEAVVAYNEAVLLEPFKTKWPIVKILLNTEYAGSTYIYQLLKSLEILEATIKAEVNELRNLVVQNDQSKLDASKPFQPFGNRPVLSSSFYIGSQEVFSKKLSKLELVIVWKGLPQNSNGFQGYYHDYLPADVNANRRNGNFRAEISVLNERNWKEVISPDQDTARLFNPSASEVSVVSVSSLSDSSSFSALRAFSSTDPKLLDTRLISISNAELQTIPADPELPPITRYDNSSEKGFMRLVLSDIDFGHGDYQISYSTQAIKAAKAPENQTGNYPLPNEPYTPLISELSVNYVASATVKLQNTTLINNAAAFEARTEQFFQIQAFGVAEQHPYILKTNPFINLLPAFNDEGSLYIGIKDLVVPQNLSVLFEVADGSADPDLERQKINWSYLSNNEWFAFPKANVILDETNGLTASGTVLFTVPKAATTSNTILPSGLTWIKASVVKDARAICDLLSINTQAVTATFADNGNDPEHLSLSLPAETIKNLEISNSIIEKVIQPYASFGGRKKESSEAYYVRVSERLRHKNRAVNIWDYERLVLEQYPTVYKVKCINHTKYISALNINEVSPGNVSLVIVSNLRNKNAVDPLKPKTSLNTLSQIHDFIKNINPPCADLHVKNPIFEEIQVSFNVRFLPGYDPGFYANKLNEDIKMFLAPWAFNFTDIVFGESVHASVIINFIEEREYVDFLACFRMDQITANGVLANIEEAVPSTSASILTSVKNHLIEVLETDDCECEDNVVGKEPFKDECPCDVEDTTENNAFGIGTSVVGNTLIVGNGTPIQNDGIGYMQIGNDFDVT